MEGSVAITVQSLENFVRSSLYRNMRWQSRPNDRRGFNSEAIWVTPYFLRFKLRNRNRVYCP